MRVSARRRSAASNTLVRSTTIGRIGAGRVGRTRNDPRHSGQGRRVPAACVARVHLFASVGTSRDPLHGQREDSTASAAARADGDAPEAENPSASSASPTRADRGRRAGARASAAAYSRGVSAGARGRPALRPMRSRRASPRAAQLDAGAAPAAPQPGEQLGRAEHATSTSAEREQAELDRVVTRRLEPRAARRSRRRRAAPTRWDRTAASRRRGSRSPPTRARRARARRTGR